MAERTEFDLFAYIFNREGETEEASTEPQEKQLHIMDFTVDNDEDGASNSTAAVLKGDRPRRAQPDRLQEPKIDQCNYITTAKRGEFDLFAYIFNRDGEEDQTPTEPEEEDVPLMNLTVDSDGASNSSGVVIQQDHPQSSSRQPRRTQSGQLLEPATDSEEEQDEDEHSSYDEARNRGRHSNVYSLGIMKFSQLEEKYKEGAQRVLDLYRDEKQQALVRICSHFMSGKCRYMSKFSRDLSRHIKCRHPNEKHPGYKITQYPGFRDLKANDFVTKTYSELKKTDPQLAEEVLTVYKRPQNKSKQKVHLCGHFVRGKCQYLSTNTGNVKTHMASRHSRTLPMIKIVGYPGERAKFSYEYEKMTYAELKRKRSNVADEVLKCYYDHNCRHKVHLCGSCDYFSKDAGQVRDHVARRHPPTTRVYKIIEYPRLKLD